MVMRRGGPSQRKGYRMNRYALLLAMMLAGFLSVCGDGSAQVAPGRNAGQEVYQEKPPAPAERGFKWVREVRYKEVRHPYCKKVPEKIYKWVYATRPDYYCLPPCPFHLFRRKNDCNECQNCQDCKGPYYRPQLKKMQVEMIIGWDCVVDYIKEQVPYTVWRKVPIGETEQGRPTEPMPGPDQDPPGSKSRESKPGPMALPPGQLPLRGTR